MIPAPFDYTRAATVDEAVHVLALGARAIAGGQSLLPLLKRRELRPGRLVDVERVAGLDEVRLTDGVLEIGAAVRLSRLAVDPLVRQGCPALSDAAAAVADPQVRHRATLGGWLAHGAPHYDVGPVSLVAAGHLQVASVDGTREIPAAELVVEPYRTSLGADELITHLRLAATTPGTGIAHAAVRRRRMDPALVVAAAWLELDGDTVTGVRVAVSGAGLLPHRLPGVEEALGGGSGNDAVAAVALAPLGVDLMIEGTPDGHALVRRALGDAVGCALSRCR
jgi:carbon-monoxide dehydrogenase medium subunit